MSVHEPKHVHMVCKCVLVMLMRVVVCAYMQAPLALDG